MQKRWAPTICYWAFMKHAGICLAVQVSLANAFWKLLLGLMCGEEGPIWVFAGYGGDDDGGDDLFFDAINVVRETGKASASLLQRRLSVGYARAAKLLDIMERKNLIGPTDGAKARKVYMEKTAI